jgi:hypothetical protein
VKPSASDLETAMGAVVHLAKRVTVADPKHAEFHEEINHLLDEWEEARKRGLTLMNLFR